MVYGELAQQPTVQLCKELVSILPKNQQSIFLTNSGTEAIEGALKLAKKATSRKELIGSFKSYHGSTQGALSLLGSENQKYGYCSLIPGARFMGFIILVDLNQINSKTIYEAYRKNDKLLSNKKTLVGKDGFQIIQIDETVGSDEFVIY